MNNPQQTSRTEFNNILFLSLIALTESVQTLIILVFFSHRYPVNSALKTSVLPEWQHLVQPEREILFYWLFLLLSISLQMGLVYKYYKRLADPELKTQLARFFSLEAAITLIMGIAIWKIIAFHDLVSKFTFGAVCLLTLMTKIFWKDVNRLMENFGPRTADTRGKGTLCGLCHIAIPIFIFASIFVNQREGVIAMIFAQDHFHHFDTFVASPVWAFTKNNILNMDTYSQYGFFMPILIAQLTKIVGQISYENILLILVSMTILYLIFCYFFLQAWLKNTLLSVLGIFLILKFQMFNNGAADPIIWRYPSVSVVRYFFDIPFFFLMWRHLNSRSPWDLLMAAIVVGVSMAYITDTGAYLAAAFYGYLIVLYFLPDARKDLLQNTPSGFKLAYLATPFLTILLIFGIFAKGDVFTSRFWNNFTDFIRLSRGGWGALPLNYFIEQEKYVNAFMAGFMCLGYLLTIMLTTTLSCRKKMDQQSFLSIPLAIYGLGLLHYYIGRSSADGVPCVSIPAILLVCFWLKKFTDHYPQKRLILFLVFISIFGLLSTKAFRKYPNCFNSSQNFAAEITSMNKDFVSTRDISLIKQLTKPDEKVCLISNQETRVLMQADRRPFLYYLPFTFSRSLKLMQFGGDALFTRERLQETIVSFEKQKPRYVFIEKQFLQLPSIFYSKFESLAVLVKYLQDRYQPFESGDYLIALKLKD